MIQSQRRRIAALLVVAAVAVGCTGGSSTTSFGTGSSAPTASGTSAACPTTQPPALPAGETRTVTIETEKGTIVAKVEGALSPIAAGNFVALAACNFYDGIGFHRVAPGFVIQGGDPDGNGTGGPGYTIEDEPVTATYKRGTLAMARTRAPNSQGSQFFIVLDDASAAESLTPVNTYAIFGQVVSGMDVADAIAAAADAQLPSNPVKMTRVTVANP
ncbi:MAG: peptidylprolyl isomerase [Chloroflexota bacterium]